MNKTLKWILISIGAMAVLVVGLVLSFMVYIGTVGPETFIVTGNQLTKQQLKVINELDLLSEGEKIRYFYSDALSNIRKGMYFVTDQKLVLYNSDWPEALLSTVFEEIDDIEADFNESWMEDGYVYVTLISGEEWSFPLSSEKGMDRKFVDYLREHIPEADPGKSSQTGNSPAPH